MKEHSYVFLTMKLAVKQPLSTQAFYCHYTVDVLVISEVESREWNSEAE